MNNIREHPSLRPEALEALLSSPEPYWELRGFISAWVFSGVHPQTLVDILSTASRRLAADGRDVDASIVDRVILEYDFK